MSKEHEKALVVEEKSKAISVESKTLEAESTALRELVEQKDTVAEVGVATPATPALAALRELTGQLNLKDQPALKERLFELVFEQIAEGLILTDFEGMIQLANPAAHRMLRYGKDELHGLPLVNIVAPDFRGAHLLGFANARLNPRVRIFDPATPLTAIAKDGTLIKVDVSVYPISDGVGPYMLGLVRALETRP